MNPDYSFLPPLFSNQEVYYSLREEPLDSIPSKVEKEPAPKKKQRTTTIFTDDQDEVLIRCKLAKLKNREIPPMIVRTPPFTIAQLDCRWTYLRKTNPELIERIMQEQSRVDDLAQSVMSETAKRFANEGETTTSLAKRRKLGTFSKKQDQKIIAGLKAHLDPSAILATFEENSGFTKEQIDSRRKYLAVIHPELKAVLKVKKVKKFELTEFDEKLVRYRLKGKSISKFVEKHPEKTYGQIKYRWKQIMKKSPQFIESVDEQLGKEKEDKLASQLFINSVDEQSDKQKQDELVAELNDKGYSLMEIARKIDPKSSVSLMCFEEL